MTNISVLKVDVNNELRNTKYYIEREIERVAYSELISQKEKVETVIELIGRLVETNSKLNMVDAIFVTEQQAAAPQPLAPAPVPTNVVEAQKVNEHGQSHSE